MSICALVVTAHVARTINFRRRRLVDIKSPPLRVTANPAYPEEDPKLLIAIRIRVILPYFSPSNYKDLRSGEHYSDVISGEGETGRAGTCSDWPDAEPCPREVLEAEEIPEEHQWSPPDDLRK